MTSSRFEDQPEEQPEVLLAHDAWLRALVRNLLDREDQVDDVVQSTWVAASQHPSRPFLERAWLGAVARNLARRARRDLGRRSRRERQAARPEAAPDSDALDPIEEVQHQRAIIDAVTRLPEPYRQAILLRYYRDLPVAAIAERTHATAANVRQRLRRGRGLLREELAAQYGAGWRSSAVLLVLGTPRGVGANGAVSAGGPVPVSGFFALVMTKSVVVSGSALLALLLVWMLWLDPFRPDASGPRPAVRGDPGLAGVALRSEGRLEPARTESSMAALDAVHAMPRELGILRVSVSLADGRPAPRFPVTVSGRDGAGEHTHRHLGVTDASGHVAFQRIEVGRWSVTLGRAAVREVDVLPGEETQLALTIPVGTTAAVRVVDSSGVRVPNAAVRLWLAGPLRDMPHAETGVEVGRTDAQGELTLVGVPSYFSNDSWVAATHPRLGTSLARLVPPRDGGDGGAAEVRAVELVLRAEGVGLRCLVRDGSGRGVSAAVVVVRPVDEPESTAVEAGSRERATGFVARAVSSDAEGYVRLGPFPSGTWDLRVQHPDHGLHRQRLRVGAVPQDLVVTLRPPAGLLVRVKGGAGQPVRGARVGLRVAEERFRGTTGPDGAIVFRGLPGGRCDYEVRHAEHGPDDGVVELASATLQRVDVVLPELGAVRGTLHDHRGAPLTGWDVRLQSRVPGQGADTRSATVDARGAFVVAVRKGLEYRVLVREPNVVQEIRFDAPSSVTHGAGPLELVVRPDQRATSFITGALLDARGRAALAGTTVRLGRLRPTLKRVGDAGGFRLGPLRPGAYHVDFRRRDGVEFRVQNVVVTAGGTTSLGKLEWPPSGTVTVVVDVLPGVQLGDVRVQLMAGEKNAYISVDGRTRRGSCALAAGDYTVAVFGGGFYAPRGTVRIQAGRDTEYRVVLAPAIRVPFRLFMPQGEAGLTGRLVGGAGRPVFDLDIEAGRAHDDWAPQLGIGTYRIEAVGASGRRYAVEFEVDTLEGTPVRRDLRLR